MELLEFVPVAIAIVAGLTQIAKGFRMPEEWSSVFEVVAGIVLLLAAEVSGAVIIAGTLQQTHIFWAVIYGIITGLTSAGLYKYGAQIAERTATSAARDSSRNS